MAGPRNSKVVQWFQWYYATRAVGVTMVLYGLLLDSSPERGTIILGGLGLIGVEKVAKPDAAKRSSD